MQNSVKVFGERLGSIVNGSDTGIGHFPGIDLTKLQGDTSALPTMVSSISKSLSDIGPQGVKDLNERLKLDFNTSHLANIFPDHMTVKNEMGDVFIYVICAAVACLSFVGVIVGILCKKRIKNVCASRRDSFDPKKDSSGSLDAI